MLKLRMAGPRDSLVVSRIESHECDLFASEMISKETLSFGLFRAETERGKCMITSSLHE